MFTGIVAEVGTVDHIKPLQGGLELTIACTFAADVHIDESISVNGVCHTVTEHTDKTFTVQSVEETLRKTTTGDLQKGDPVNLERSLTLQKGIEGHLVQGHVDTVGKIRSIHKEGANWLYTIEYPKEYRNLVVGRGSICVEGISLTIAREEQHAFTVAIIPYTREHTDLKAKEPGDGVNLEFDIFGKYVVRYMETLEPGKKPEISADWLREQGFE